MSEDSMFIVNDCVPDEKYFENTFILFIFRVCKFWREEKKTKLQLMPLCNFVFVTENLSIFFLQHFIFFILPQIG